MKKVIPFTTSAQGHSAATGTAGHPGATATAAGLTQGAERQLLLVQRLLGCGEQEELIRRFLHWARDLSLANGVAFQGAQSEENIALGKCHKHRAQYELNLDRAVLGSITLYRRQRYREDELSVIEQALGTLARCLRLANDITALRALATRDALTGLRNRRAMDEWLSKEISRTRRHAMPLTLMMIDVDHFKVLNDRLGHPTGDHILKTLATVLNESTRASDLSFRFGGDEFAVLLPQTGLDNAVIVGEQIRRNLGRLSDETLQITDAANGLRPDISIGIAALRDEDTHETLLRRADTHLYHAKAAGGARACSSL